MESSAASKRRFGAWHWIRQIAPPSLILVTLFATDNGGGLVFLLGLFIVPVLVSLVSILLKLFDLKNRKYFLLRPGLTISFFAAVFLVAQWSYEAALSQATDAAELLQAQCSRAEVCPDNPQGWTADGSRIIRTDLGHWHKYAASYYYDPDAFAIRVYMGPDVGHVIRGGVDAPIRVAVYLED